MDKEFVAKLAQKAKDGYRRKRWSILRWRQESHFELLQHLNALELLNAVV